MPSEKQIEAAQKVFLDARPYMGSRELATLMLTASEQAEPAPTARSGAAKEIVEEVCEGWCEESGGRGSFSDCFGCRIHRDLSALEPAEPADKMQTKHAQQERVYRNTEPRDGFVEDGLVPIDRWGHPTEGGSTLPEPATEAEPVSHRWRLRTGTVWVYDPSRAWLYDNQDNPDVVIERLYTRPPEPEGNAQPWGYWVKHKYAEGGLVRTPCFTPKADYYTDVVPLYTHPPESRLREALEYLQSNLFRMCHADVEQFVNAALAQEDGR